MRFNKNEAWSFTKSGRDIVYSSRVNSPGPADYKSEYNQGKNAPSWKIANKYYTNTKESNPGVGQYNIPTKFLDGPKYSITKADKKNKQEYTPGPLDYDPHKDKVLREFPKYTIPKKHNTSNRELSPGPGDYNSDKKFKSPICVFGRESRQGNRDKNNASPGVGAYNQPLTFLKKAPGWKIGTSGLHDKKSLEYNPGPSDYKPNFFGKKAPGYSISKSSIIKKISTGPGPGDYSMPTEKLKGITIKRKYYFKDSIKTPGPQDYRGDRINFQKKSPAYSMGKSQRGFNKKSQSPGPGDYNSKDIHKKFPICTIGKQKRSNDNVNSLPGPADYHIPCSIRDLPKFVRVKGTFNEEYTYI